MCMFERGASPKTDKELKELDLMAKHNIDGVARLIESKNNCNYPEALTAIKKWADFMAEKFEKAVKVPDYKQNLYGQSIGLEHPASVSGDKEQKIKIVFPDHLAYATHLIQNRLQCDYPEALKELKRNTDALLADWEKIKARKDKK